MPDRFGSSVDATPYENQRLETDLGSQPSEKGSIATKTKGKFNFALPANFETPIEDESPFSLTAVGKPLPPLFENAGADRHPFCETFAEPEEDKSQQSSEDHERELQELQCHIDEAQR